jgi:hypothetical protein
MWYEEPGGHQNRGAKEREEDSAYTLAHAAVLFSKAERTACAASSSRGAGQTLVWRSEHLLFRFVQVVFAVQHGAGVNNLLDAVGRGFVFDH